MIRSTPDLSLHLQRQLGLTSHCFPFRRLLSVCPFQTHFIVEFQGPHLNAMWQWTGWFLCVLPIPVIHCSICSQGLARAQPCGRINLWFLHFIKTQKVQGLQEEVEEASFLKDETGLDIPACWPWILDTLVKPSEPLSILICVKENDTYLTQLHGMLLRLNKIHMPLKNSLLTTPSPQPRKIKLTPFVQNLVAESSWVRRWG